MHGSVDEQYALKAKFGLEDLEHNDDFGAVIEIGPWLWQENSFYTGYSGFCQFCDAIEVSCASLMGELSGDLTGR
jgi:hypothetical protein